MVNSHVCMKNLGMRETDDQLLKNNYLTPTQAALKTALKTDIKANPHRYLPTAQVLILKTGCHSSEHLTGATREASNTMPLQLLWGKLWLYSPKSDVAMNITVAQDN